MPQTVTELVDTLHLLEMEEELEAIPTTELSLSNLDVCTAQPGNEPRD